MIVAANPEAHHHIFAFQCRNEKPPKNSGSLHNLGGLGGFFFARALGESRNFLLGADKRTARGEARYSKGAAPPPQIAPNPSYPDPDGGVYTGLGQSSFYPMGKGALYWSYLRPGRGVHGAKAPWQG
jgi:hypothetical protein